MTKTTFSIFINGFKPGKLVIFIFIIAISFISFDAEAQRFPKPEFESGYEQIETQIPVPRSNFMEYFDVFVLFIALGIITWIVLRKRSRTGVFWVSVFSVLYFGFFREGCVCSVGSLQNVTLALFNPGYKIPITVLLFFILPLLFTLLFGRTFCAGVCPLGAIQDFFVIKPLKLKNWVQKLLGLIPYFYLGLAVLYAATNTDFIICRYDPFVSIFRLNGEFSMFLLGGLFLSASIVIARPYCRFFCPYGVLLNWMSRISLFHMTITPTKCVQCKLCEGSCPFDAIDIPDTEKPKESKQTTKRRFIALVVLIPLITLTGAWSGYLIHEKLAIVNSKVELAIELIYLDKHPEITDDPSYTESFEVEAFRTSGQSKEQLFEEAKLVISKFRIGSILFGGFIGLVFGITLAGLSVYRYKNDYEPNKGECLSCARCMDYCPVDDESKLIEKVK